MSSGSTNFEPRDRRARLVMTLDLASAAEPPDLPCRGPVPGDLDALAALMHDAYNGTVDYTDETLDDARKEIELTLANAYGRFLADCSLVADGEDGLAAACLVTLLEEGEEDEMPLVAFSMTRKRDQHRGLAGALILRAAATLRDRGYARVALVVTADNHPARRLYDKLGFRPEPGQ